MESVLSTLPCWQSWLANMLVLHCVQVPLTSTTMARFSVYKGGRYWFVFKLTLYIIVVRGAPLYYCTCNGPTPWQCSEGYLVHRAYDYVIFSLGIVFVSFSAHVLGCAAPFGSATTFAFGAWDWCHTLGSLPLKQSTTRKWKKPNRHKTDSPMHE